MRVDELGRRTQGSTYMDSGLDIWIGAKIYELRSSYGGLTYMDWGQDM